MEAEQRKCRTCGAPTKAVRCRTCQKSFEQWLADDAEERGNDVYVPTHRTDWDE